MKKEDEFKDVIHDIGYDPFFVQYNSAEQINIYMKLLLYNKMSKVSDGCNRVVDKKF